MTLDLSCVCREHGPLGLVLPCSVLMTSPERQAEPAAVTSADFIPDQTAAAATPCTANAQEPTHDQCLPLPRSLPTANASHCPGAIPRPCPGPSLFTTQGAGLVGEAWISQGKSPVCGSVLRGCSWTVFVDPFLAPTDRIQSTNL